MLARASFATCASHVCMTALSSMAASPWAWAAPDVSEELELASQVDCKVRTTRLVHDPECSIMRGSGSVSCGTMFSSSWWSITPPTREPYIEPRVPCNLLWSTKIQRVFAGFRFSSSLEDAGRSSSVIRCEAEMLACWNRALNSGRRLISAARVLSNGM